MGFNFYVNDRGFPERIREAVERAGGAKALADKVGVKPTSVYRWTTEDGADPSHTNLVNISRASGLCIEWLATGEGPKLISENETQRQTELNDARGNPVDVEEFVFIPRYNVEAAAGYGYGVENESIRFPMAFRRYWIERYLCANPAELSVIPVTGDSMTGLLEDGDVILVNHAKNTPAEGIYVVRIGNDIVVKRTQLLPGGVLLLKSENDAYEPIRVNLDEDDSVAVIGKVEWFGRQI